MTVQRPDPERDAAEAAAATEQLIDSAAGLSAEDLAAPSLLPGWTRGHILAHVARNADALVNLLEWARTGEETPMYPDAATRDRDIEAGAPRSLEEHLEDLRDSAARFTAFTIRGYVQHRHTFPANPFSISPSLGSAFLFNNATTATIIPGVQYPH